MNQQVFQTKTETIRHLCNIEYFIIANGELFHLETKYTLVIMIIKKKTTNTNFISIKIMKRIKGKILPID